MKILVTGAGGFIGKNLVATLRTIDKHEIFEYHHSDGLNILEKFCRECDFVFHLAGVNRPENPNDFTEGNETFTSKLVNFLEQNKNNCPIVFSSSVQAELDNYYGRSKLAAEKILLEYEKKSDSKIFIYRLKNVFGKWCLPNYNSVVSTFCFNAARSLPLKINDPSRELELVYIDDVIKEFLNVLEGSEVQNILTYKVNLQKLADIIQSFTTCREKLSVPNQNDEFIRKLYSTYQSYLSEKNFSYALKMHADERGSFSEFIRTEGQGQFSVNVVKPHITKGNHWHHSKHEKFLVVSGEGVIRFRKIFSNEIIEYKVSGSCHEVVDIPPGYTHSIENIGDADMTVVIWANENFNPEIPDTFFEKVIDSSTHLHGGGVLTPRQFKIYILFKILIESIVKGGAFK
ncbi:MAG: NAD-dependent epimerase/dehydratase family protein [Selenomonadaceae bacterium]|nr:NAD-dependent epimerase/dehydratase family protein [Selenomonadaceae bacterium]